MSDFIDHDELLELRINFMDSTKEKLDNIESIILKAEAVKKQDTNKTALKDILALTHSIKGSSRSYKFDAMAIICNKLEDFISELLNHDKIVSAEELTKILKHTDILTTYCDEFIKAKKVDDSAFLDRYQKMFSITTTQKEVTKRIVLSKIKLQILVVGVNKTIMKQVYMALADFNYNISFAADPLEAFHRISLEKFELVISSYMMDPIDGLSFIMALKNQWKEKAPHVILLATDTITTKIDKSLLPEKIMVKSLTLPQEMQDHFMKEFSFFAKTKDRAAKTVQHKVKSIYFVEDDENILDLCLMIFTQKKDVVLFNEITTADPFDRINQMMPDLIISDIHVPNVDTTRLLLKIKTTQELSHIPVVFFSGDPEQPIASELLKIGALAVLDKTIILTSMIEELEKLGIDLQG
jgi:CheY-like chemotaxis protein/HPt (histidine-containing phosphotransfer) domain-containing protein